MPMLMCGSYLIRPYDVAGSGALDSARRSRDLELPEALRNLADAPCHRPVAQRPHSGALIHLPRTGMRPNADASHVRVVRHVWRPGSCTWRLRRSCWARGRISGRFEQACAHVPAAADGVDAGPPCQGEALR